MANPNPKGDSKMTFQALELSIDLIRSLRGPVEALRSRDPALHRQIRAAASSVALNLGEGNRRVGADRRHLFRIAAGSAEEVRVALRVAEAWGDLDGVSVAEPLGHLDRLLGMLWRLTR
jgi:four helix bundle protein